MKREMRRERRMMRHMRRDHVGRGVIGGAILGGVLDGGIGALGGAIIGGLIGGGRQRQQDRDIAMMQMAAASGGTRCDYANYEYQPRYVAPFTNNAAAAAAAASSSSAASAAAAASAQASAQAASAAAAATSSATRTQRSASYYTANAKAGASAPPPPPSRAFGSASQESNLPTATLVAPPASAPSSSLVDLSVTVPDGARGGDAVRIMHNGKPFEVVVPQGLRPGQTFVARVPVM